MDYIFFPAILSYIEDMLGVGGPRNQRWYCILQVYSSCLCSNYILIAMTYERFYSIIRPLEAASVNTVKRARIIIVCVFLVGFSYSVPFWFIGAFDEKLCYPNLLTSEYVFSKPFIWFTEVLTFIFPFVALLTMNSVIIHTLRKKSMLTLSESIGEGQGKGQGLKMKHSEQHVFAMLLLLTFAFLILNIPTRVMIFYLNFTSGNTPDYYATLHFLYQVGKKSNITNHGINFFLYAMSGQKFRTDLKNLFLSKQENRITSAMSNVNTIASSVSSGISK